MLEEENEEREDEAKAEEEEEEDEEDDEEGWEKNLEDKVNVLDEEAAEQEKTDPKEGTMMLDNISALLRDYDRAERVTFHVENAFKQEEKLEIPAQLADEEVTEGAKESCL